MAKKIKIREVFIDKLYRNVNGDPTTIELQMLIPAHKVEKLVKLLVSSTRLYQTYTLTISQEK